MSTNTSTTILLAVDVAPGSPLRHVRAAVEMTRTLIRDDADRVVVLHVREFSVSRLGRMMTDDGGADGKRAADEVVSSLRAAGIHANSLIREADVGHVARTILGVARDVDARVVVLGSRSRTGLPHIPLGSVATHLLHLATGPVLIVPRPDIRAGGEPSAAEVAASEAAAS